jgi:uncharacterized membrane protein
MATDKRLRGRLFTAALLGGVAVWSVFSYPRLTPGLAALALAQGLLALFWTGATAGRPSPRLISAFVGVSYLGLAYLAAAVVGPPSTTRFWLVFSVEVAIFAPLVLLAGHLMRHTKTP